MEFNVTMQQWIDRFVSHLSRLQPGVAPTALVDRATALWSASGQLEPEAVAEKVFKSDAAAAGDPSDPFEATLGTGGAAGFEKTERIPVERIQADGGYVRDNTEWISRCVARVLMLDPIIKADEARRSVTDLASLERWRVMSPEAAADQLYTPIKPRHE